MMKKIIYGLIVLIGGVLIASNFNIDSSKLDHKTVSASGTACRWISDTGYGVGPIYLKCTNKAWHQCTTIIPCSSSNAYSEKGVGVYSDDGVTPLTDTITFSDYKVKYVDGKLMTMKGTSSTTTVTVEKYEIIVPAYSIKYIEDYSNGIGGTAALYTIDEDLLPTKYTCVCAEY